jgi:hypothetical protein
MDTGIQIQAQVRAVSDLKERVACTYSQELTRPSSGKRPGLIHHV